MMSATGHGEEKRDRIIARADDELARAKARIAETLKRYHAAVDDFESELEHPGPDPEDLALRAEVEEHEAKLDAVRWAEIDRISEINRRRRGK